MRPPRAVILLLLATAVVLAAPGASHAAIGDLGYDGCVADAPSDAACTELPPAGPDGPLRGAAGIRVAPDNGSVYVAGGGTITRFNRGA